MVKSSWNYDVPGRPLYKFAMKLKMLKLKLKAWNKEIYGNIHQGVQDAEDEVIKTDVICDASLSEANKVNLCAAQQSLNS